MPTSRESSRVDHDPQTRAAAEDAWVLYKGREMFGHDRRALRKREFIAGFFAALKYIDKRDTVARTGAGS